MNLTKAKLKKVYEKSPVITFGQQDKFIIMSDCHRGQGNANDNFVQNQTLFAGALKYYYQRGFTYIELGDGDELWENKDILPIIQAHKNAYNMLIKFQEAKRLYMLYGNHDLIKSKKDIYQLSCDDYFSSGWQSDTMTLPKIQVLAGLILEEAKTKQRIFLTHGHQASILNDTLWPITRFVVRYLWKPLEMISFKSPSGTSMPVKQREKVEKRLMSFAEDLGEVLIVGHTHRPAFPSSNQSKYFNDGSCVFPGGITGIEIENSRIALVKWLIDVRPDNSLYVAKQYLVEPVLLSRFFHN